MLDGMILIWFVLAALAVAFVAIDIRSTPESPVLKWGFVLLTAYTGAVGAVLYWLGCRGPSPGTHELFVAARWRQTLGSTMHCVAGDGVGILVGAVIASALAITGLAEVALEYVAGLRFRLDDLPGAVHEGLGRRLLFRRAEAHLHSGASLG